MKIILTASSSGMCLSILASFLLAQKRGIRLYPYRRVNVIGIDPSNFTALYSCHRISKKEAIALNDPSVLLYTQDMGEWIRYENTPRDSFRPSVDTEGDAFRTDKNVLEIVEKLGYKACAKGSLIWFISIPDDSYYVIAREGEDQYETCYYSTSPIEASDNSKMKY